MRVQVFRRRGVAALASLALAVSAAACDSLLEVQNPGAINEPIVTDSVLLDGLVNSADNEFQRALHSLAYAGAILSDEAVTGHNFFQWQEFDLRIVDESNSVLPDIYNPAQRTRTLGDDMARRLRELIPNPDTSVRVARALVFAGLGYTFLGEMFCEAPLAPDQAPVSSEAILTAGLTRFTDALAIGTAARTAAGTNAGGIARADTVIWMSKVGAARISLFLNNKAAAIQYATGVPADFRKDAKYNDANVNNAYFAATQSTNRNIGVDAPFRNLGDPRVRHGAAAVTGHNPLSSLFIPSLSPSFSGWTAASAGNFTRSTSIRYSSGLEARYILAEAQGPTVANVDFINSRRAVGGQAALPYDVSAADFLAAVRDQRRRDFYLDGHRLGDIRRYLENDNLNFFPTGAHPFLGANYGTATCYVPTLAERVGNTAY